MNDGYFLGKAEQVLAGMPQTYDLPGLLEVLKQDAGIDAVHWPNEHEVSRVLHEAFASGGLDGSKLQRYERRG